MEIQVTKGVGSGPTEIAAFDQALVNAGVANFNLLYLSSVVPPNTTILTPDTPSPVKGTWGDRLYVVMAQKRVARRNKEAWAGIGWVQDPVTNQGLFVEHEGYTEDEVREDIESSLEALCANRNMKFGPIQMVVNGIKCKDVPVCALVVAVFESNPWKSAKPAHTSFKLTRKQP